MGMASALFRNAEELATSHGEDTESFANRIKTKSERGRLRSVNMNMMIER